MASIRWTSIILAGGQGTRMKSPLPKVLHPVAGEPMIHRVINSAKDAGVGEVRIVVGYSDKLVRQVVEPHGAICYKQEKQLGTADAVGSADVNSIGEFTIVLNGDHPLLTADDIKRLIKDFENSSHDLCVVSSRLKKPGEFGRIIRHKDEIQAIVEVKDASAATLKVNEVNTGIYLMRSEVLCEFLPKIENHNANGEYYFTDIISLCKDAGKSVGVIEGSPRVAFGVNNQAQLAKATQVVFRRKNRELLDSGVILIDPQNTYIEDGVSIGSGTVVYPGNYVRGKTTIGSFCVLEPNCLISDCEIHDSVQIKLGSCLEQSIVRSKAKVGPYARLRPQTELDEDVQIGNFVELKKTKMGKGAKAGHLSYLGDAEIGKGTNIGCGTITCNYAVDRKKYKTKIGDDVFVGSDTQFVAPIEIGDSSVIASGSTITKNVPERALAVARGRQIIKENYISDRRPDEKGSGTVSKDTLNS